MRVTGSAGIPALCEVGLLLLRDGCDLDDYNQSMSHAWLTAMGVDVQHPHGAGKRTLLGHRLLCILRAGSKSMRDLHAATGRYLTATRYGLQPRRELPLIIACTHESWPPS